MLGPETILGVRVDYFTDASPQQPVRSVLWTAGGLFNPNRTRVLPWRVGRGGAAADVVVPGDSFPATGWLEAGGGAGGVGGAGGAREAALALRAHAPAGWSGAALLPF